MVVLVKCEVSDSDKLGFNRHYDKISQVYSASIILDQ